METDNFSGFFFFDEEKLKNSIYLILVLLHCKCTVTFGLLNASLLNKISDFFQNLTVNI